MSYNAYVCKIKNLRKHPNADRLMLGECFGNTVCVDTSYEVDELGIYFPTDGQVSPEFAEINNLLRKKDENGKLLEPIERGCLLGYDQIIQMISRIK